MVTPETKKTPDIPKKIPKIARKLNFSHFRKRVRAATNKGFELKRMVALTADVYWIP
jgi:hypothetical protein